YRGSNIWKPVPMSRLVLVAAGLAVLAGCQGAPAAPPFKPIADVKQLMEGTIDPNADVIWDATGWIDTAAGEKGRGAPDQAGGGARRKNAITQTQAGKLLLMVAGAQEGGGGGERARGALSNGLC